MSRSVHCCVHLTHKARAAQRRSLGSQQQTDYITYSSPGRKFFESSSPHNGWERGLVTHSLSLSPPNPPLLLCLDFRASAYSSGLILLKRHELRKWVRRVVFLQKIKKLFEKCCFLNYYNKHI